MNDPSVVFPFGLNFKCLQCGSCCKTHPSDVNAQEQKQIEAMEFTNFLDGIESDVTRRIRTKNDGSCFFLSKENKCEIHDIRPAACKLEPLTISDYDYENNKIVLEINPAVLCSSFSCKGFFSGHEILKVEFAEAAKIIVREVLESFSKKKMQPITSLEVAFLTRQYFKQGYTIAGAFAKAVSMLG